LTAKNLKKSKKPRQKLSEKLIIEKAQRWMMLTLIKRRRRKNSRMSPWKKPKLGQGSHLSRSTPLEATFR